MTKSIISPHQIKKILIVQVAGIGDLVLATPTLRALRDRFFQSHISLLTLPRAKELIIGSGYIDEVFTFDLKKYSSFLSFLRIRRFKEVLGLVKKLRQEHFDMTINLYGLVRKRGIIRMALLLYLIGTKYRVGRNTDGRGFFYNIKVPEDSRGSKHEVERNLDVARVLGADIKDKHLEVHVSGEDDKYVSEFLRKNQALDSNLIIGFNPGAAVPSHLWGKENFARLGDKLVERYKCKIVITGGPEEIKLAYEVADLMQIKPLITTGKLIFKQSAALIKRCDLFISNETGPMHIAVAMNTPLIALLGPASIKYFPYGDKERFIVIKKDVSCSPCYKLRCKRHVCMELITVEEVMQAAVKLIERISHV